MASASQQREISGRQLGYIEKDVSDLKDEKKTGPQQQISALQRLLTNAGIPDASNRAILGHSNWVKRLRFFLRNMEVYERKRYCHDFFEYYGVPIDDAPQRLYQFPLLYDYTFTIRRYSNVINVSNWFQWYLTEMERFELRDDMVDVKALKEDDEMRDRLIADPRTHTANVGTSRPMTFLQYLDKQELRKAYKDQFQH